MATAYMKEAVVLCLDIGPTMWEAPYQTGRASGSIKLHEACQAFSAFVQQKVMDGKKTEQVGLVLFGCDRPSHMFTDDGQFPAVVVRNEIDQADINMIRFFEDQLKGERGKSDFIDAIIVAADLIARHTDKKRFAKRIIIATDAAAEVETDLLDSVIDSLNKQEIRVQLFGLDFDDPDAGVVHRNKSDVKRANEELLRDMAVKMEDMDIVPMTDALARLSYFRARNVRQTTLFRGPLDIAGEAFQVPIYVYSRTAEARAPTFGKVYVDDQNQQPGPVTREITYQNAEDITAPVDASDLVKAYRYGKTLVPFNKIDEEQMSVANEKCMSILGFAKSSEVPQELMVGNTLEVQAQPSDPVAYKALSALIHALYELDRVAIVRYCRTNSRQPPKLGVLTPHIRARYECLLYSALPFAEDVRLYNFGTFNKVALTQAQLDATDAFINALDLSNAVRDADGDTSEDLKPSKVPNVTIHRLQEAIKARAIHPNEPITTRFAALDKIIQRNSVLWSQLSDIGTAFESAFKLKKTEKAEKREVQRQWKGTGDASASGGAAASGGAGAAGDGGPDAKRIKTEADDKPVVEMSMRALTDNAVSAVGTTDPVGDFRKMVGRRDRDFVQQATDQMAEVVVQLVRNSFGAQSYDKALECVEAYRKVAIVEEEWAKFNTFLRRLKDTFKGKAGHAFWERIVAAKATLIASTEVGDSDVSAASADQFLREDAPVFVPPPAAPAAPEEKDLLAELE